MKILYDENAYTTSMIMLLLLIPIFFLMLFSISQYEHDINNTAENLEVKKIKTISEDIKTELEPITQQSLHEISLNVSRHAKALPDSRNTLKTMIQQRLDSRLNTFKQEGLTVTMKVINVDSSDDPFKIRLKYSLTVSGKTDSITDEDTILVDFTDDKFPVYDPLPALKTGINAGEEEINYRQHLADAINLENSHVYNNAIQGIVIRKCPLKDYSQHGNSNSTIINCLNNHYYHNSHDALCLLCRLENRTSCGHYGFETFIVPTIPEERAPVSIDHVLLNDLESQYMGDSIILNNSTVIYLDNGHKLKYGL